MIHDSYANRPPGVAISIDGEPFLRASTAARILTGSGVSPLDAGRRLHAAARAGRLRTVAVHARAWLYAEADVLAEADRLRGA